MNKNLIGNRIRAEKENVIKLYRDNVRILDIAVEYGVVESTIYMHLRKWGVPVKRKKHQHQERKVNKYKRKFSPEFLAHRAEITRLNEGKIKYIEFEHSTEDQRLVKNIISHPIIG